jgi:hypothetical protein
VCFGYVALQLKGRALNGLVSTTPLPDDIHAQVTGPKTLDDLVLESVDEVLADLLGRKCKEAIYDHLERNYSIDRENIPKNLQKFFELLEETFGRGSKTIGKAVIRKLFEKLGWEFGEVGPFEFFDYLNAIRARIARELIEHAKSANRQYNKLNE